MYSMTREECTHPEIIDGSRRLRIAQGSGMSAAQVAALVKQFGEMQKMMRGMMGPAFAKKKAKRNKKKAKKGGRVTAAKRNQVAAGPVSGLQLPDLPADLLKDAGLDQSDVSFRLPGR